MTYYHVVATVSYGATVSTVPASDAKDAIMVNLRDRHVIGTRPYRLRITVYEKFDDDPYMNGTRGFLERKFAGTLSVSREVLSDCNVTITPQKIIAEDIPAK